MTKLIKWKDNLQFSFDIRNTLINAIEKVGGDIRCTDESGFIFEIDNRGVHVAIGCANSLRMNDKEVKELKRCMDKFEKSQTIIRKRKKDSQKK